MVKIVVSIESEINDIFKEAIFKRMGMKRGNISIALNEAIKMWLKTPREGK